MAVKTKDLKVGTFYWHCPSGKTSLVCIYFMNKVDGRKAYRFAENGRKKLYILHEYRLNNVFESYDDAVQNLIKSLKNDIQYYESMLTNRNNIVVAPNIRDWSVARGIPRYPRIGRR